MDRQTHYVGQERLGPCMLWFSEHHQLTERKGSEREREREREQDKEGRKRKGEEKERE